MGYAGRIGVGSKDGLVARLEALASDPDFRTPGRMVRRHHQIVDSDHVSHFQVVRQRTDKTRTLYVHLVCAGGIGRDNDRNAVIGHLDYLGFKVLFLRKRRTIKFVPCVETLAGDRYRRAGNRTALRRHDHIFQNRGHGLRFLFVLIVASRGCECEKREKKHKVQFSHGCLGF